MQLSAREGLGIDMTFRIGLKCGKHPWRCTFLSQCFFLSTFFVWNILSPSFILKLYHVDLPDCHLVKVPHFHPTHHPIVAADKKRCISNEESAFDCSFYVEMGLCSTNFILHICIHAVVQHDVKPQYKTSIRKQWKITDMLASKNILQCTCRRSRDVKNGTLLRLKEPRQE